MQNVENDMDDLFKRAAENYSLVAGKGDWEGIAKRLRGESPDPLVLPPVKNRTPRKIITILIFLVFLTGGFGIKYFGKEGRKISRNTKNERGKIPLLIEKKDRPVAVKTKTPGISAGSAGNVYRKQLLAPQITANGKTILEVNYIIDHKDKSSKKNIPKDIQQSENDFNSDPSWLPGADITIITDEMLPVKFQNHMDVAALAHIIDNINISKAGDIDNGKEDKSSHNTAKKKRILHSIFPQKKGLYIGLLAGPDFSKVHSTSFNNIGFDAGLVLGFRVNSKFAVETGIARNKKNYTSEGKMFNMDKVGPTMPNGMVINTLESQSSLIEVPVKIKYNFTNSRRSNFFLAGGVSAYIMTKEKNQYNATLNGIPNKFTGVYTKNDYRFPAVATLTLGYEHNLNHNIQLRIEPFLKIPLQGMGIGNLPLTSVGLQAGFIHVMK